MKVIYLQVFLLLIIQVQMGKSTVQLFGAYVDPANGCSAFCGYLVNGNGNLDPGCGGYSPGANGGCTYCDSRVFVNAGGNCVPHMINSEALASSGSFTTKLGYYSDNSANNWINNFHLSIGLPAHYAVRVRFGVQFYQYYRTEHFYEIGYSLDQNSYFYNQQGYWSSWDIITSDSVPHTAANVVIKIWNNNRSNPFNSHGCGGCACNMGCGCGGCAASAVCCEFRYAQINDVLVFASKCQVGCLQCQSPTNCTLCDVASLYYLNL